MKSLTLVPLPDGLPFGPRPSRGKKRVPASGSAGDKEGRDRVLVGWGRIGEIRAPFWKWREASRKMFFLMEDVSRLHELEDFGSWLEVFSSSLPVCCHDHLSKTLGSSTSFTSPLPQRLPAIQPPVRTSRWSAVRVQQRGGTTRGHRSHPHDRPKEVPGRTWGRRGWGWGGEEGGERDERKLKQRLGGFGFKKMRALGTCSFCEHFFFYLMNRVFLAPFFEP